MQAFRDLDQVLASVGADLGLTSWHPISQEDVQKFAEATNANEWIHVDVERARGEGPFGTTVAHGYLTLSLATAFVTELLELPGGFVGVNYGLDRVRFPSHVPVGSRVRARGILMAAERVRAGIRTNIELTYEGDQSDKPPCVAEVISLVLPVAPDRSANPGG